MSVQLCEPQLDYHLDIGCWLWKGYQFHHMKPHTHISPFRPQALGEVCIIEQKGLPEF